MSKSLLVEYTPLNLTPQLRHAQESCSFTKSGTETVVPHGHVNAKEY